MVSRKIEPRDARAEVVATATRLFAAHGYDGTSIQAIADALGLTKTAVLHHYASKEELREAVLGAMIEHWQRTLPALLLRVVTQGRFDAVFGELHRFFASDPDRAKLVVREAFDRPAEARKLLRHVVRPWLEAIASYVERGRRRGEHRDDLDPEAYVTTIMTLVIASAATAHVCEAALEPGRDGARARLDREMRRIARASLFVGDVADDDEEAT
jgi:TetR/AcrR family transcriptional regulator